jgi:protein TonB
MTWRPSPLSLALLVSLALHGALLTVRLVAPERFNRAFDEAPLEVVLVNARTPETPDDAPDKAQAIAQARLAGGGDAARGRATSPLPPSELEAVGEAESEAERKAERLQELQQQLLTQVRREIALMPPLDPQQLQNDPQAEQKEEHRRQMLRMLAEIEKRINDQNARPKKRYISPSTREEIYAVYYDALRRRIEERGTRDFPEFQGQKLYGELTMNLTIDSTGKVIDAEIVRPSQSKLLNQRALAIVRAAGPFGPFTPAMRRQADQIVVTSRFRFTRTEGLATSLGGNSPSP